jgi:hypothetical protein
MSTMSEGPMDPPKSWWSRNWAWFLPMGCLGLLLSCGCLGAVIAGFTLKSLRDTGVFAEALTRMRQSPEARDLLGEPIEADWKIQGSLQTHNGEGSAQLGIPVHGPKASGTLQVEAYKRDTDTWTFTHLSLEVPDRPTLDLLGGPPSAPPGTLPARPDLPDVEPLPDDEEPPPAEPPPARDDKNIEL